MGMKTKGGMWCDACERPVAAVKSTHRLRNSVSILATPATLGGSLLGTKSGDWHCPTCGGPVRRKRLGDGNHVSVAIRAEPTQPAPDGNAEVRLEVTGPRKIEVIKQIRSFTGLQLRDAKPLADSPPSMLGSFTGSRAVMFQAALQAAGATATVIGGEEEPVATPMSDDASGTGAGVAAQLASLAQLHAADALTDAEFVEAKARVLEPPSSP